MILFDSDMFMWFGGEGVTEMSVLDNKIIGQGRGQSGELSFSIKSNRTNSIKNFSLYNIERDKEFDIICWNFMSTDKDNIMVKIFND